MKFLKYYKPNKRSVLWKDHTLEWKTEEEKWGVVRGEQAMWRAVILQALEDAASQSKRPRDRHLITEARYWLEGTSKDFATVCDLAGLDIQQTRKNIKRALMNQCKWRVDAGLSKKSLKKNEALPPFETKSLEKIYA